MSKSYNNTIGLFAEEDELRQQIFSIVTDSASLKDPKDPDRSVLYAILKLFCDADTQTYWADRFRSGGLGYREVKQAIFDKFLEKFGPARARRQELLRRPEFVDEILIRGVEQAQKIAVPMLAQVRDAVGIRNN
jgi:tryptophanyl-tRNA synthetase